MQGPWPFLEREGADVRLKHVRHQVWLPREVPGLRVLIGTPATGAAAAEQQTREFVCLLKVARCDLREQRDRRHAFSHLARLCIVDASTLRERADLFAWKARKQHANPEAALDAFVDKFGRLIALRRKFARRRTDVLNLGSEA